MDEAVQTPVHLAGAAEGAQREGEFPVPVSSKSN